jgi:hypothetical protein
MPIQGGSPPQGQRATGWRPIRFSLETCAWAVSALCQTPRRRRNPRSPSRPSTLILRVASMATPGVIFSDVPRTLLRKFETCDISSDTNGTNGSRRFLAPHRYVLRAFEARPRRPTSLLPGVVRRRGDPRIRLGCDFRPDDHAKPKLGVGVALHIVERRVTRVISGKVITR